MTPAEDSSEIARSVRTCDVVAVGLHERHERCSLYQVVAIRDKRKITVINETVLELPDVLSQAYIVRHKYKFSMIPILAFEVRIVTQWNLRWAIFLVRLLNLMSRSVLPAPKKNSDKWSKEDR